MTELAHIPTDIDLTCSEPLRATITAHLDNWQVTRHNAEATRRAAVAIIVVDVANDGGVYAMTGHHEPSAAALLLTRRASGLKNHAGQWAFPGGRIDAGETSETAALRELEEEVGLKLDPSCILGRLDDYSTRSGFAITPVVVWGGRNVVLRPNPDEVASVHRIAIKELLRQDAPLLQNTSSSPHPILLMPIGQSWIASPTGAMLYQFREVAILGRSTRVDHFEQPFFAWR
jgi:mutator protein MutT